MYSIFYLGKHIISHTMSSTGGSNIRLTLSPLVLALNTLVAEFLYAQNCHFTLSVFCTEIPFRNTLPDFESMRKFRFNHEEIYEIWEAVTGSKANKRDLHKQVIQNYETNPNISLLMLILKYLLKKDPLEQHKRNAEVQTETKEKIHKSISAHNSERENKTPAKMAAPKDDNLKHINNYLQKLSDKVLEMTQEFEKFTKQCHESRTRNLKSARNREYYNLNKSLERITENMKVMAQTKRKNKRLTSIVESIDNLTQQFGKCAQNFDNVTKVLGNKEEKPKRVKLKVKEKQTETEFVEKSYAEWIYDMRNTENGQKFLNRVEKSLRKALAKHREQLQNETEIKMKHLKSLMRLHYQQKLSKHLLHDPKVNLDEVRKCNDNIERKLQQFEKKQIELMHKLQDSSQDLKEAQEQRRQESTETKSLQQEINPKSQNVDMQDKVTTVDFNTDEEQVLPTNDIENIPEKQANKMLEKIENVSLIEKIDHKTNENVKEISEDPNNLLQTHDHAKRISEESKTLLQIKSKTHDHANQIGDESKSLLHDVSKAQEEILVIAKNIAEEGRSVDHIIYDAKLRIQQLENESNQLEQNFQSYLERRKRSQEQDPIQKQICPDIQENLSAITSLKQKLLSTRMTNKRQNEDHKKSKFEEEEQDADIDEEFQRIKETLQQSQEVKDKPKSAKSDSSTSSLEIRNAILEAKLKFFEHENTIRKCREQGEELRSGNFLQKELEKYTEMDELAEYMNENLKLMPQMELRDLTKAGSDRRETSLWEIKEKTLNEDPKFAEGSIKYLNSHKPEDTEALSVRRELFPKEDKTESKDKSLDGEQDIDLNRLREQKSQRQEDVIGLSTRRELFPKQTIIIEENRGINLGPSREWKPHRDEDIKGLGTRRELFPKDPKTKILAQDLIEKLKYPKSLAQHTKTVPEKIGDSVEPKNNSDLLKRSMAKMQKLFEQQAKSQETLREMVKDIVHQKETRKQDLQNVSTQGTQQRPQDILDKSFTTTMTSTNTTTITTNTSQMSEELPIKKPTTILTRFSNKKTKPAMLNLSSDSEESFDSKNLELEITQDTIKDIEDGEEENEANKKDLEKHKAQEDIDHISESYESSELHSLPFPMKGHKEDKGKQKPQEDELRLLQFPKKNLQKVERNFEQELGEIDDSPNIPVLDLYSPANDKEIGEVLSESNRIFAPINTKISESSTTQSSSELEISTGHQTKNSKNLADEGDSESDFWA
ncbi:uncharacterized protein ACRADG_009205 isoform 2-T2 [Cochliomyia hominivorax]